MRCLSSVPHRDGVRIKCLEKKRKCYTNTRVVFLYLLLPQRQLVFMSFKNFRVLACQKCKNGLAQQNCSLAHFTYRPQSVPQTEHCNLRSFLLACNSDSGSPSNWLVVARLVNRIFYLLKTAKYCTRGRSWAAGREQQMERSLLIVLISWKTTQEVLGNQCQGQSAGKAFLIGINSWTGMLAKNLTIHCPF